jgi:hypothetical protein
MTIEISPESSKAAIASIQRYFSENLAEEIGNLDAGALLGFFLKNRTRCLQQGRGRRTSAFASSGHGAGC